MLQPLGVLRTPHGELALKFGGRRRAACIELGHQVPALVVDGTTGTPAAEITRIFTQMDENDQREELTAAERAGAVQELFSYGADERTVTRRTGLGKAEIAAARKAAASETARALAAQYPLTMPQLAVITEFDDAPEVAAKLARVAADNPGQFAHQAQEARDARADAAMVAARTAELAAEGITVTTASLPYENALMYWAGPDRQQLTAATHRNCPGHVVTLYAWGSNPRQVREGCHCADPRANGHKKYRADALSGKSAEEATAERRRVREGNDAWRSATTVRQQWLRDVLLARKDLPAGAALFIARALAAADHHLINTMTTMSGGRHPVARELLGVTEKDTWNSTTREYDSPLVDSLSGISDQRAQTITLALIIGSYEGQAADPQTWRSPSRPPREYLSALAGWGYPLSEIEQSVVGAAGNQTEQAAAAAGEENGNA